MGDFIRCDKVTSKWEGGNVDHPKDPGGRTSRGVIQRVYDGYRDRKGLARRDVYTMTETERRDIFHNDYFVPIRGAELPNGLDLTVYDCCVNSGQRRAVIILQASLVALGHKIKVDGNLGPATMAAVRATEDVDALVIEYARRRQGFVESLKHFDTFGKGWTRRISGIRAQSTEWAVGSVGKFLPVNAPAEHKATDEAVATTQVSTETAAIGTGGTVIVGAVVKETVGDQIRAMAQQIEPYVGLSDTLKWIMLALVLAAVAYTVWTALKSRWASSALRGEAVSDVKEYITEHAERIRETFNAGRASEGSAGDDSRAAVRVAQGARRQRNRTARAKRTDKGRTRKRAATR